MGRMSSKLRKAARRMVLAACASFSCTNPSPTTPLVLLNPLSSHSSSLNGSDSTAISPIKPKEEAEPNALNNDVGISDINNVFSKSNLCAICLEALIYTTGNCPGQAIFTAQCSHAFHFACISSNVRHGSVSCPICRAHWTQLPRNLSSPCTLSCNQTDPIFQILDDSIATFRVHRRSFLRSARYNDDDPTEPDHNSNSPRLDFSLLLVPPTLFHPCTQATEPDAHYRHLRQLTGPSSSLFSYPPFPSSYTPNRGLATAYLSVKTTQQRAIDLVLVASPNGPHLRLVKQSMALVVFSLRAIDRLAIVTYSSSAARIFPLRRMTSYGKRTALQVIDRVFFMGQADPIEGLKKGIKILEDRAHRNPQSCILHLSDSPTRSYHTINMQVPIPIHRFHVGFGFSTSNGFIMHEFEEFLITLLGGVIRDVQLRIEEEDRIIRLGDLRGNEERRIRLNLGEPGQICVSYSYVEGGIDECFKTGEAIVSTDDKGEPHDTSREVPAGREANLTGGRTSSVESWDYHDPCMARRWAKHLHAYRL